MIRGRRADPDDDAADDVTPTGAIDDDAAGMSDIFGARIPGIDVHIQAIMSGVPRRENMPIGRNRHAEKFLNNRAFFVSFYNMPPRKKRGFKGKNSSIEMDKNRKNAG